MIGQSSSSVLSQMLSYFIMASNNNFVHIIVWRCLAKLSLMSVLKTGQELAIMWTESMGD